MPKRGLLGVPSMTWYNFAEHSCTRGRDKLRQGRRDFILSCGLRSGIGARAGAARWSPFSQGSPTAAEGTAERLSSPEPLLGRSGVWPKAQESQESTEPRQAQSYPLHPQGRGTEVIIILVSVYVCGDEQHLAEQYVHRQCWELGLLTPPAARAGPARGAAVLLSPSVCGSIQPAIQPAGGRGAGGRSCLTQAL